MKSVKCMLGFIILASIFSMNLCSAPVALYGAVNGSREIFGVPGFNFFMGGIYITGGARLKVSEGASINSAVGFRIGDDYSYASLTANALFLGNRIGPYLSLVIPDPGSTHFEAGGVFSVEKQLNEVVTVGIQPTVLSIVFTEPALEILSHWSVFILVDLF
jgi:hypothetical protein